MQNENQLELLDADIATDINTLEETLLSKASKCDMDKSDAATACVDIGAMADSCGKINKSLEVPCTESPIQAAWLVLLLYVAVLFFLYANNTFVQ